MLCFRIVPAGVMVALGLFGQVSPPSQTAGQAVQTKSQILGPLSGVEGSSRPLTLTQSLEVKAPDGTVIVVTVHKNPEGETAPLESRWPEVMRVWLARDDRYRLLKTMTETEGSSGHLIAETFRFHGKVYLHLITAWDGSVHAHEDEFYRVEAGRLTTIRFGRGGPASPGLAKDETVNKSSEDSFRDDNLTYEYGIWKLEDPSCCPRWVIKGTYTIIGDEIRVATVRRTTAN
jgi:hypothetical protein